MQILRRGDTGHLGGLMPMNPILVFALLAMGLAGMLGQILLLREMVTAFYGNELSLGIMLGNWLLWVGVGSWIAARRSARIQRPLHIFLSLQVLTAILLPLTLLGFRWIKVPFGLTTGEMVGLEFIYLATFLLLTPLGLVLGSQFTLGARLYAEAEGRRRSSMVYALEALGALAAGLLFSYYLVGKYQPLEQALLTSLLVLFSAGMLISGEGRKGPLFYGVLLLFLIGGVLYSLGVPADLEVRSRKAQWAGLEMVQSTDSIYGNIVVTAFQDQFSFFENGVFLFSTYDIQTVEETVHFPMLQHPDPSRVLLLGGGMSGTLREVLRHPVDRVDYVELDPLLVETSRKFALEADSLALEDPRVKVVYGDGRRYLKETDTTYDVIILDLPAPYNAQVNRFYTTEFYHEVAGVLEEDGIISLSIPSSEEYISPGMAAFQRSIYGTLKGVFPHTLLIPGARAFILASPKKNLLTYNINLLELRRGRRWVDTAHVNRYLFRYRFDEERLRGFREALEGDFKENTDTRPISYYYNTRVWASHFSGLSARVYGALEGLRFSHVLALVALTALVLYAKGRRWGVLQAVAATGFSGMVIQVVMIYVFQVFFGHLYYRIGLLMAAFMLGIAAGSIYTLEGLGRMKNPRMELLKTMAYLALLALLLPRGFGYLSNYVLEPWAEYVFYGSSLLAGALVGAIFPLAVHLLGRDRDVAGKTGRVYGADLLGACLGAFSASSLLLPLLGVELLLLASAVVVALSGTLLLSCGPPAGGTGG